MNSRIHGPQVVLRTIRPPRVAYVVQTLEHCERLVEVFSLTWGGQYFCMIPCNSSLEITEEWWNVLQKYDPDLIFTCTALSNETSKRLKELTALKLPKTDDETEIPMVNPADMSECIQGQTIYSVLASLATFDKKDRYPTVIVPSVSVEHPLHLYIKAALGSLDESWTRTLLARVGLRDSLRLGEFIETRHDDMSANYIDYLRRVKYRENAVSLIDLTLISLTQQSFGPNLAASRDGVLYDTVEILVVSEEPNVEDYCWFWDLRGQRYHPYSLLPLWLPIDYVESNLTEISTLFRRDEKNYILSKTVPNERLKKLVETIGDHTKSQKENLDEFYAPRFFLGIQDQQEVVFNNGMTRIPYPEPDVIKNVRHPDFYCLDIEISDYKLPRLNVRRWGSGFGISAPYRVSRTGLTYTEWGIRLNRYIDLALPTAWRILQTYAEIAGYSVAISDKGKIAIRLLSLIDDILSAWIFSGESVYRLLNDLAELSQAKEFKRRLQQMGKLIDPNAKPDTLDEFIAQVTRIVASEHHERRHFSFGEMKQILDFPDNISRKFVQWLVGNRLLFRGVEVRCPNCMTKQWLEIDEVNTTIRCRGCQKAIDIPLDVGSTNWQYRANALLARAYEQGVVPHILTLFHLAEEASQRSWNIDEYFGAFPGVRLTAIEGADVAFDEIELDFVLVSNGELRIGECKTRGKELTHCEVERFLSLAQRMQCTEVVFSALDDFDSVDENSQQLIYRSRVSRMITGEHLNNQYPGKSLTLKHFPEQLGADKEKFTEYLDRFLQWHLESQYGTQDVT